MKELDELLKNPDNRVRELAENIRKRIAELDELMVWSIEHYQEEESSIEDSSPERMYALGTAGGYYRGIMYVRDHFQEMFM